MRRSVRFRGGNGVHHVSELRTNRIRRMKDMSNWNPTRIAVVAIVMLGLLSVTALSGCQTVKGFGRDVQDLGESLEDSASRHTGYD